ncbi:hypothetical protein Goarm_022824, partial [Gossypium armourianum]|nr:hypothetical protein [Gossypium armourianum]
MLGLTCNNTKTVGFFFIYHVCFFFSAVSITNQETTALKMLRENRSRYDLVITSVNMPDMDAFKLLELVGLEMDLPVIMLSAHGHTKLVKKGITHGTCDYLLKPVYNKQKDEDPSIQEKPRVVWSVEVYRKFVSTVNQLGLDSEIYVVLIRVSYYDTAYQKYRLCIGLNSVVPLGSKDSSYLRRGPLDGFGYFRILTRPGKISSAFLPSYQPGGMFGRLNASIALSLHGIYSSVIQPRHSQTSNNPIKGSRKIQAAVNKPTNGCGEFNHVNDPNFLDARVAVGGS